VIVGVAIAVALLSALGSLNRLRYAVMPTAVDIGVLVRALRASPNAHDAVLATLERVAVASPDAEWERDLIAATKVPSLDRAAHFSELVNEFHFRLERWVRVPRVLASVSSSACFLLATLLLRRGLTTDIVLDDSGIVGVDQLVMQAVNVAALGLAGTAVCVAAQLRARRIVRARAGEVDTLMELLDPWTVSSPA
jgi:hypothetical protein